MQNEDRMQFLNQNCSQNQLIWLPCHVVVKWSIQKHDTQRKFFELTKHSKTDFDVNSQFIKMSKKIGLHHYFNCSYVRNVFAQQ